MDLYKNGTMGKPSGYATTKAHQFSKIHKKSYGQKFIFFLIFCSGPNFKNIVFWYFITFIELFVVLSVDWHVSWYDCVFPKQNSFWKIKKKQIFWSLQTLKKLSTVDSPLVTHFWVLKNCITKENVSLMKYFLHVYLLNWTLHSLWNLLQVFPWWHNFGQ